MDDDIPVRSPNNETAELQKGRDPAPSEDDAEPRQGDCSIPPQSPKGTLQPKATASAVFGRRIGSLGILRLRGFLDLVDLPPARPADGGPHARRQLGLAGEDVERLQSPRRPQLLVPDTTKPFVISYLRPTATPHADALRL